ncbi:aldehyde ferredoxin oxidoreductase family protein [Candidatus Bathyarchaeota archaeon]|nr:aldehyde ferredoxin oxidoreductase family protein [Candidatus Bathyarchaeota archaeon]
MHGWMGKVLRIELSRKKTSSQPLTKEQTELFLGGRGLGVDILFRELPRGTNPLSPENKMVFATGPLTGTGAPTSGRYSVITRSPLTGTIFDSNSGGHFGVQLKRSGWDAVVVEGKAEKPSYLWIRDESIEIRNADHIWGSNTHTTEDTVKSETDKEAKVACIGPAGERQVLISAIINDKHRAAGRGGVGAVMGSKNLKAIAVLGTHETPIANREEFTAAARVGLEAISKNPVTKDSLPNYGTAVLVNVINEIGALPTMNFRRGYFEDADAISGETIRERIFEKRVACDACTIACGRETKIPGRDRHGEGPEYETIGAFGAACGVRDLEAITEANYLCNEYGLDTISTGSTIACAMELSDTGHLTSGPRFGDSEAMVNLVKMIGERTGIGNELAEGSFRFAERHGHPEFSMSVKGLEIPAYDPRGIQGMGVAYATSNRGACHLRAYMTSPEVLGNPALIDRFKIDGKASLTILLQNISAATDSMVLCRFSQFAMNPEHYARLLRAVTDIPFSARDLMDIGERIFNLERVFNVREGFGREADSLPKRVLETPLPEGHSKNVTVALDPMLDEYYRLRGWTSNGIPTINTLSELKLHDASRQVEDQCAV